MSERNGAIWKAAALLLAGGLMGNVFALMQTPSRDDIEEMIDEMISTQSPWLYDRSAFQQQISYLKERVDDISVGVKSNNGAIQEILQTLKEQ